MLFDDQFAKNLDMIESVLVALAAYVAIRVALGWRHDFLGKRRLEIQEDVLTKMHELKDLLGWLQHSLRYIEFQQPEPAVGETTIALKLAAEDAVQKHQSVLAKLQEINALEVKARLLFEPEMLDVFRVFTVARVTELGKVQQVMGHVGVLETLLEGREEFDERLVEVADKISEKVAKAFEATEVKPHSFEILSIEIDRFCKRLALFRHVPRRLYEKWTLKRIRQRFQK